MLPSDHSSMDSNYRKFSDAAQQIANIVAIDYFFAKEIMLTMTAPHQANNNQVLFHLLIVLSDRLRQGHSCLPLETIASSHYGFQSGADNIVTHQGFVFPDLKLLSDIVTLYQLAPDANYAVVYSDGALFMRRYYRFEQEVLAFVQRRCFLETEDKNKNNQLSINKAKKCLEQLFPVEQFTNHTSIL